MWAKTTCPSDSGVVQHRAATQAVSSHFQSVSTAANSRLPDASRAATMTPLTSSSSR